ncbi:hypothetical protein OAA16_01035, partial [Candidatus Pelagibacter sp.]|nr:hypothetical protein [Candidatus Pelagibacter sp.]
MSKISYPRVCECCAYTAKNQQSWSQHTKTKKHKRNSGEEIEPLVCVPCEPIKEVSTDAVTMQSLLQIIATQAETIKQQHETIVKLQNNVIVTPQPMQDVSNNVFQPNITLQITDKNEVVSKVLKEPEPEPEVDNCVKCIEDVLEDEIKVGSVQSTHDNSIRAYFVDRFLRMKSDERPIRYKKDKWQYKYQDEWISGNNGDMKNEINKLVNA